MFRNATLKQRLLLGFGAVILSMLVGTAYSLYEVYGLTTVASKASGIGDLGKVATLCSEMVGLERGIVLHAIFDDKAQVQRYTSEYETASRSFDSLLESMSATVDSEEEKSMIETLRKKRAAWGGMHASIMKLLASQQVDVAQKKISDPAFIASTEEVKRAANDMSESASKALEDQAGNAKTRSLIGSAVLVLLSLSLGALVLFDINRISESCGGSPNRWPATPLK